MAADQNQGARSTQSKHSMIVYAGTDITISEYDKQFGQEVTIEEEPIFVNERNSTRIDISVDNSLAHLAQSNSTVTQTLPVSKTVKNRRKQPIPIKWVAGDRENGEDDSDKPQDSRVQPARDKTQQNIIETNHTLSQNADIIAREHDYSRRSVNMTTRDRKSEVEKLFSSLNNLELTAFLIRNRPSAARYELQTSDSNASVDCHSEEIVEDESNTKPSPKTRSFYSRQLRSAIRSPLTESSSAQAGQRRSQRLQMQKKHPVEAERVSVGREKRPLLAKVKKLSVTHEKKIPHQTLSVPTSSRQLRKRLITGTPVVGDTTDTPSAIESESTVPPSEPAISNSSSSASSNRSRKRGATRRHDAQKLPKAASFRSTFSFNEVFFGADSIPLAKHEEIDVSSLPQDHYLRKWRIKRRLPTKI